MSNRLLVNVRGCNGSGKSTIPMSMMDDPYMYVQDIVGSDGKRISSITVFPLYEWVALGTYFNKTGGLDTLKNNWVTELTLFVALDMFPEYDVLMEGIMASTILSTYVELFNKATEHYEGIEPEVTPIIVSLVPPFEVALSRVYERNGGKPINEDSVKTKYATVKRNVKNFRDLGFISVQVDSSKVSRAGMLPAFLRTVNKYREL